jgi:predicted DNA-binding protein (MmcQ/YjbR family)
MKELINNRIIIHDNIPYSEIQYKNEQDLERLAVEKRYALFGNDIVYFDIKKKITSNAGISRIPDGLFFTLPSYNDAKLWLVEYELSNHDLERHITPQILGFMKALQNESTKKTIREMLYKQIKQSPASVKKIKSILPQDEEIHYFIETILDRELGIVIVIDKKTPELEEVADSISGMIRIQSQILEFITFENSDSKKIHMIDTLSSIPRSEKTKKTIRLWETRIGETTPENRSTIDLFISTIIDEFRAIGKPWHKWYAFYLGDPTERKKLFAVIYTSKNKSSLCFRVDPEKFRANQQSVRIVKGFFFPGGTERRISLSKDNFKEIIECLKHSYKVTKTRYESKMRVQ